MVNWQLAGNPWNWLIVMLMFYIASFGVDFIARYVETKKD
jgi:hypothetical protein